MQSTSGFWHSPTRGYMPARTMIETIVAFFNDEPTAAHRLLVGTDSLPNGHDRVYLVTAVVVHRVGYGGIYFWQRKLAGPFPSLRHRIRAEAERSLRQARWLRQLRTIRSLDAEVTVHLDIGHDGATRAVIQEVVAHVQRFGLPAETNPPPTPLPE